MAFREYYTSHELDPTGNFCTRCGMYRNMQGGLAEYCYALPKYPHPSEPLEMPESLRSSWSGWSVDNVKAVDFIQNISYTKIKQLAAALMLELERDGLDVSTKLEDIELVQRNNADGSVSWQYRVNKPDKKLAINAQKQMASILLQWENEIDSLGNAVSIAHSTRRGTLTQCLEQIANALAKGADVEAKP